MKISVTAEHIRKGVKNSFSYCPIALAFHDAGFPEAEVGTETVGLQSKSNPNKDICLIQSIVLPVEVRHWIYRFDTSNRPSFPFEFEFNAPNTQRKTHHHDCTQPTNHKDNPQDSIQSTPHQRQTKTPYH